MKRKYFLLLVLFCSLISVKVNAQIDITGEHQINTWIESTQEYMLTGWAKRAPVTGIFVKFNEDGSFITYERKGFKYGCFKTTEGFYKWEDKDSIRIYFTKVHVGGLTCAEESSYPKNDLGLFFVHRNWYNGAIRLIPNKDSLNVDTQKLIDSKDLGFD